MRFFIWAILLAFACVVEIVHASVITASEASAQVRNVMEKREDMYKKRSEYVIENIMIEITKKIDAGRDSFVYTQISSNHADNQYMVYNDVERCRVARYVTIKLRDIGYDVRHTTLEKEIFETVKRFDLISWFDTVKRRKNLDACAMRISWEGRD